MTAADLPAIPQGFDWKRKQPWVSPAQGWTLFPPSWAEYQRMSAVDVLPVEVTTARGSTRRAWVASVRHKGNRYTTEPCRTRDAAARAVLVAAGITSREEAA